MTRPPNQIKFHNVRKMRVVILTSCDDVLILTWREIKSNKLACSLAQTYTQKHTKTHSQLQDKHHLSSALKNIFESYNVSVLNSLKDLHFLLNPAFLQSQATACVFLNLQELPSPRSTCGTLTNLSDLSKMPPELART